jgi:hypothetical protein
MSNKKIIIFFVLSLVISIFYEYGTK